MGTDPFDPTEFLDSEEARAEYVRAALDTGDAGFVARSLAVVARARAMAAPTADEAPDPMVGPDPTL